MPRFFECRRHGEHGTEKNDAFPVDGFVSCFDTAQTAGEYHGYSSQHDGCDGGNGNAVEGHGYNHEQHDEGGKGGFVVEGNTGGLLLRLTDNHPFGTIGFVEPGNVVPRALHEDDVGSMKTAVLDVVEQIVVVTANTENVQSVGGTKIGLRHGAAYKRRSGQNKNFGHTHIVKVQSGSGLILFCGSKAFSAMSRLIRSGEPLR